MNKAKELEKALHCLDDFDWKPSFFDGYRDRKQGLDLNVGLGIDH